MLVEMQIENNKLKEECEATKFELTNRVSSVFHLSDAGQIPYEKRCLNLKRREL